MKDKTCEVIRRELDELTLNEKLSPASAGHLQVCSDCREFHRQQIRLRQIVGSLGTVSAPADFDFRLRARLAAEAQEPTFRYWSFAVKGLATAAVLVVFGVGSVVVWQRMDQQPGTVAVTAPAEQPVASEQQPATSTLQPVTTESSKPVETVAIRPGTATDELTATVRGGGSKGKIERPLQVASKPKRPLVAVDFGSERADVITSSRRAAETVAVFPIEASLQSFKVSLDDGRGNARTISFPTVSFGSQRMLTGGNQFAPKGIW